MEDTLTSMQASQEDNFGELSRQAPKMEVDEGTNAGIYYDPKPFGLEVSYSEYPKTGTMNRYQWHHGLTASDQPKVCVNTSHLLYTYCTQVAEYLSNPMQ